MCPGHSDLFVGKKRREETRVRKQGNVRRLGWVSMGSKGMTGMRYPKMHKKRGKGKRKCKKESTVTN